MSKYAVKLRLFATFVALLLSLFAQAATASSLWDQVQSSGELRVGSIDNRIPYMWSKNGRFHGFTVTVSEDLAKALSQAMKKEIRVVYVTTTWATAVLDLQAGRIEVMFTMAETEERKRALDLFGPLYELSTVAVSRAGSDVGSDWSYFDNPDRPVAVITGSSEEAIARKRLPQGKVRSMKDHAGAILDVQSGNSVVWITNVLNALNVQSQNSNLKNSVILQPLVTQQSGGGVRKDGDGKFHAFLKDWAREYHASGKSKKAIVSAITEAGLSVDNLPKDYNF